MKRAAFDIDNKVLAGVIVGAVTYAATKLAIPIDSEAEQAINVGAALLAAYFVPSSAPAELTGEGDEGDDVPDPPTSAEVAAVRSELATATPALELPDWAATTANGDHGGTATIALPAAVTAFGDAEVDELSTYGEVNRTGLTEADVADELASGPLDDIDE
ncbi:hypothetical protein [Candidatus Solirubrobacter pratensis]|uniref:hypothetical protein n=1 Tax=Candidatus Solirubrobacter pratensis TaxID=1298857 RepID=UPI0004174D9C|nr:hypothetical protein [Candidatus Solirubrobacter pratensis]